MGTGRVLALAEPRRGAGRRPQTRTRAKGGGGGDLLFNPESLGIHLPEHQVDALELVPSHSNLCGGARKAGREGGGDLSVVGGGGAPGAEPYQPACLAARARLPRWPAGSQASQAPPKCSRPVPVSFGPWLRGRASGGFPDASCGPATSCLGRWRGEPQSDARAV